MGILIKCVNLNSRFKCVYFTFCFCFCLQDNFKQEIQSVLDRTPLVIKPRKQKVDLDAETVDADLLPPPLQPQIVSAAQPVPNIFDNLIECQAPLLPSNPMAGDQPPAEPFGQGPVDLLTGDSPQEHSQPALVYIPANDKPPGAP